MKKITQPRKLRLATETVRKLDPIEIGKVVGGLIQTSMCNSECLPGCPQH